MPGCVREFWATWCEGCKEEIPWFSEFQKTNGTKSLAVMGVSMDEGGWPVVKPFLAETHVPYRILLGDDATAQRYGIQNRALAEQAIDYFFGLSI